MVANDEDVGYVITAPDINGTVISNGHSHVQARGAKVLISSAGVVGFDMLHAMQIDWDGGASSAIPTIRR